MKIAFIVPYPLGKAASQRFRFEQYLQILKPYCSKLITASFNNESDWKRLYEDKNILLTTLTLIKAYISRLFLLPKILSYDYLFIHREATPLGPPWFEFIAAKILRKKLIYDFDDAIWLEDPEEKGSLLAKLKWKSKVAKICKWSYKISVGNQYLGDFASEFNENILIIPTTIDTDNYHNPQLYKKKLNEEITIGWTGTHSTLQYLDPIIPILKELEKEYTFRFLVIANKPPHFKLKSLEFLKWNKNTEIEDLLQVDIGIMPLTNDEWSKGKCGFKLLQYMALEIPSIASPVGVNTRIIATGENGFIYYNENDFIEKINLLLKNSSTRQKIGIKGRQTVIDSFSVTANTDIFLSLFR